MSMQTDKSVESLYDRTTRKVSGTIHHYTSYPSAVSIIKNRSFQFTRIDLLNDKTEELFAECCDNEVMYVLSFTNTTKESVAMWMLYGGVVGNGGTKLRISIPRKMLIQSFDNQFHFDSKMTSHIPLEHMAFGEGALSKKRLSLKDVVYLDRRNGNIRFAGKVYKVEKPEQEIEKMFKGFIKYDAWEFETEARISVGYSGAVKPPVRRTGNRKSGR